MLFEKSDDSHVKVLATYEDGRDALIECQIEKGRAILSGVHFEYDCNDLNEKHLDKKGIEEA